MGTIRGRSYTPEYLDDLLADGTIALNNSSPRESFGPEGFEASAVAIVAPWADRHTIAQRILGGVKADMSVSVPIIYKVPGMTAELNERIRAVSVTISPYGDRTDTADPVVAEPQYANIEISFQTVEWQQWARTAGPLWIAEEWESSTEFLTFPPNNLFWNAPADPGSSSSWQDEDFVAANALAKDEAPGKIDRRGMWVVRLYFLTNEAGYKVDELFRLTGTINRFNEIYSPKYEYTFATNTLLWGMPTLTRAPSSYGVDQWTAEIPIQWRQDGWDRFLRSGDITYRYIYSPYGDPDDGYKVHPYPGSTDPDWTNWLPVPP